MPLPVLRFLTNLEAYSMEANHQTTDPDSRSRLHAALAYVLAGFSGLILLVLRREDRFVQFHALQSIAATVVAIALALVLWLFSFFPLLGFLYGMLLRVLQIALFVLWLYLLWQAYRGRWFRIPYVGDWAHKQVL
jgi:uncharacterized membrane protein